MTGAELGADAVSVTLALEGTANAVDLAPASAADLREELEPILGAARNVGRTGRGSAASSAPTGEQAAALAWLVGKGVDVPSRGRLSAELLERHRAR